jgi:transglutaminase-like putative cysteine protease/tetratricopeptide (TPR) repeat protein
MGAAPLSPTLCLLVLLSALGPAPARAAEEPPAGVFETLFSREKLELERRLDRPEAIASLAGLLALEENLPPGRLEELLRGLADGRKLDPLVAAHVQYRLALLESRRGDSEAAARRYRELGLIFDFQVVGPFDAQGRGAVERAFPPEAPDAGPAPERRFPGKERDVAWREVSGVRREGALALDGLLRPDSDAVAYTLTYVYSDRRRPAVLRLGSVGPIKAWVGGRVVLEKNVVREARLDQDAAAVVLEKGENPVLLKSVVTGGAWRLFVRFTDQAGRTLPGLKVSATGSAHLPNLASSDRSRRAVRRARDLGGLLRLRAESSRGAARAAAWLDYGRYLAFSRAADRDARELDRALDRAVEAGAGPPALRLLGEVAGEDDDRRRALERAATESKDPAERALALAQLGILARASRRESAAFELLRSALAADPHCVPAVLALAVEEQLSGLPASGLARLDALPAALRELPAVRLTRARLLEALGRRGEADRETAVVYETRQNDVELGLEVARAARHRGDAKAALELLAKLAQHRPDLSFIDTEWARLLEGRGDIPGARKVLEQALVRLPDESTLHEELGRLLLRAEDTSAGIEQLRQALALRPQNPALRRYLARLTADAAGGTSDPAGDWARPWIEDGRALAGAVLGAGAAKTRSRDGSGAVVLLDQQVVRVHSNGTAERFAQRLVHVQSEQAAREQLEFQVRYTPGTQEVEIRRAQIYRRSSSGDIEVLQAAGRDDRDLSEPWYGLYYDLRADVVVFEGLKSGDVLEIQYTLSDVASESALSGYFGDIDFVAETAPRVRWRYILIGPAGRKFHFNRPRVPGLEYREEERGQEVLYTFAANDIARVVTEPGMPGWAEISPYLHISTYASWEEMARWYWRLVEDQLTSDQNLVRAAAEATAGASSTLDKVRAVHRFVLENTRYVALEFGIHGYKPYRVSQVLSRRFGDCKDKASLMLAMLREVGIESELVLLRTRRGGRVEVSPASLAVFDHAIVYVPALSLYLDGTAEFAGLGELPFEDQGVTALRVGPKTATLVETPVLAPSTNRAVRRWQVELQENGTARVEEEVAVSGQAAPEWREHYQTPGERKERFGKVWSGRFPGATLQQLELTGPPDRNVPVVVKSVAQVPKLAEPAGPTQLRLPLSAREEDFVRSYARLSQRQHELVLAYPWQQEQELHFRIPPGWRVDRLPPPRQLDSDFGRFRQEVTASDDRREMTVRSTLEVSRNRISAREYPGFRAFLANLDGAFRDTIIIRKQEQAETQP